MSRWPDLGELELFVAVVDHGSLAAAARLLGMAQPNASRSIRRLEGRLGLKLLNRTVRGAVPTDAGLVVAQWARATLDAARALAEGSAALAAPGRVPLRVGASQTVGEHLLPGWLADFRAAHESGVHVEIGNTRDVIDRVRSGVVDVGFVEGPVRPSGVHGVVVGRDELVVVVAPGHPWAARTLPLTVAELVASPLVVREVGSGTRMALAEALGTEPRPLLELSSNAAVKVAVAAGSGPAVLSMLTARDALERGDLCRVPLAGPDLHRDLRAVWTGPRTLRGPAGDLVDIARQAPRGDRRGRPPSPAP